MEHLGLYFHIKLQENAKKKGKRFHHACPLILIIVGLNFQHIVQTIYLAKVAVKNTTTQNEYTN